MKKTLHGILFMFLLCGISSQSDAEIFAYDGFDYPTGWIETEAGFGWVSGETWGMTTYAESPGDTYPYMKSIGNRMSNSGDDKTYYELGFRSIDTSPTSPAAQLGLIENDKIGVDGKEVWISFLCTAGSGYGWKAVSIWSGCVEKRGLASSGSSTPDYWSILGHVTEIGVTEKIYVLIKIEYQSGEDLITGWVNPDLRAGINSLGQSTWTRLTDCTFDRMAIRTSGYDMLYVDEIRIGTSYEDVCGSPTTVNPYPEDGQTDVEPGVITLNWEPSNVDTGVTYDVNVSYDDGQTWDYHSGLTTTQLTLDSMGNNEKCLWRVNVNNSGNTFIGALRSFETVVTLPVITEQPRNNYLPEGRVAEFSVEAESATALSYAWYKEGSGSILSIDSTLSVTATSSTAGKYYCVLTNVVGSVETDHVELGLGTMIGYWTMDSLSSPNSVVSGTPATSILGSPTIVEGITGSAVHFDGQSALYVQESGTYFNDMYKSCTVSCWVKTTDTGAWKGFVNKYGGSAGWALRMNSDSNKPCFTTIGTGGVENGTQGIVDITNGNWHHVVGTFDGYEKRIYVNGKLRRIDVAEGNPIASDDHRFSIGVAMLNSDNTVSNGLMGAIDEVGLYTYALSSAEVGQLYATAANKSVCPEFPKGDLNEDCRVDFSDFAMMADGWLNTATTFVPSGLIGYWTMDSITSPNSVVPGTPPTTVLGSPTIVDGVLGSATYFNGTSAFYIEEPQYGDEMYTSCTVSYWIRTSDIGSWRRHVCKYSGTNGSGWALRTNSTSRKPCFSTILLNKSTPEPDDTITNNGSPGTVVITDNKWHHIVGTFDGVALEKKIYVDGDLKRTDIVESNEISHTSRGFAIGAGVNSDDVTTTSGITGAVDEVRLYDTVLSADDITELYVNTLNGCPVAPDNDLTGDCEVDFEDFTLMADKWLLDNWIEP
ncbi:MAG: hypothetical protein A2Y10_06185 [Planctomycetes bacterium GWF2_41_51]|nr:MAG: hypothetical protein A2Y10_06185 [Planctomycetes bacterium GWF2_41_51]HBG26475.1 hypothetical protein [Phycisphaerales bacterium]